jgi:hypothetical protein
MRLLILADIDDLHWVHGTGQAEVLLSCGDIHDEVILEARQAFGCPTVFAIKGDRDFDKPFLPPIIDLHLRVERHGVLTFGGLNDSWRYKPRGFVHEQNGAKLVLTGFPYVDVFASHNSPRGIHDTEDETHYGFEALNDYISKAKPRLLVHGHQRVNKETEVGATQVIGVYGYRVFELAEHSSIVGT